MSYGVGLFAVFLSLALWCQAEDNIHLEHFDPSADARTILFGRPIMSIAASVLPPRFLNSRQPCHSMDAQYPESPCSPQLYSSPEQEKPPSRLGMETLLGGRYSTPAIYRYPYANYFRQSNKEST